MNAPPETRFVAVRFYLRPSRTLVTQTVHPGVGGRAPALWSSGGRLDLGAGDLGEVPPRELPLRLCAALVAPGSIIPMDRALYLAWQRSWVPGGRH